MKIETEFNIGDVIHCIVASNIDYRPKIITGIKILPGDQVLYEATLLGKSEYFKEYELKLFNDKNE